MCILEADDMRISLKIQLGFRSEIKLLKCIESPELDRKKNLPSGNEDLLRIT